MTTPLVSITDEMVVELEALASKATPGPWSYDSSYVCTVRQDGGTTYVESWNPVADALLSKNVQYIATANPATILALLSERAELKRDAERYRWLRDCHGHDGQKNLTICEVFKWSLEPWSGDDPDRAIDKAMQAAK